MVSNLPEIVSYTLFFSLQNRQEKNQVDASYSNSKGVPNFTIRDIFAPKHGYSFAQRYRGLVFIWNPTN